MSTPFDESKVKRDHGRFAPKGYDDVGQLDLGAPTHGESMNENTNPAWGKGVRREVDDYGNVFYRLDGGLHREDGPAVELANGTREYWRHNRRHRVDGPAIEAADGSRLWYFNGFLHRDDEPAIERPDGERWWYRDGLHHRKDGPAIERADGASEHWLNGQRHRIDGLAIEWPNGKGSFYLYGEKVKRDDPRLRLS